MRRRNLKNRLVDLFFPPACVVCGELISPDGDAVFCPRCRAAWDEARLRAAESAAAAAVAGRVYLVDYRAGETDGVPERFIYHLKHKGDPRAFAFAARGLSLGVRVALRAAEECCSAGEAGDILPPLVTYPPRRRAGIRADGFDQAARLARGLAAEVGGDFASLLRRARSSDVAQKFLDAAERAEAARIYAVTRTAPRRVNGRMVILCDDLCTTGATLAACRAQLLSAGARGVVWVTVGRTEEGE